MSKTKMNAKIVDFPIEASTIFTVLPVFNNISKTLYFDQHFKNNLNAKIVDFPSKPYQKHKIHKIYRDINRIALLAFFKNIMKSLYFNKFSKHNFATKKSISIKTLPKKQNTQKLRRHQRNCNFNRFEKHK